ncbi:PREDICTED: uncharacterized protein LOC109243035 [Nicotiana attenuata]|uniref:Mesoderm development candidate 2 n=1 Tax=Nicotiana attenuata TaxID=49451 RepID=A0A1J6J3R6_NICAT|nr:PREDICTED: uncharacterized protein LOC109243035 [Nicotiana attenuata]OIT07336.1 hypothetical protein A4A49_09868 [Nicotiana attenuata]
MLKELRRCCYTICLLLLLITTGTLSFHRFADGLQRRIHVSDDLNDVVDNEEEEQWSNKKEIANSEFDPPPNDVSKMSPKDIQAEMMKRVLGPVFGFVKLRPGTLRTPVMVSDIAKRWTNLARTGAIETKFIGVDFSTIMFTMEKGQDTKQLKEFLLEQEEAYEIKIGDQLFRRPGDPPFEEVFEKFQNEIEKNRHSEL